MAEEVFEEAAPTKGKKAAKVDAAADTPRKPHGQNAGDEVEGEVPGGRYEAIGAGKYRRLPD